MIVGLQETDASQKSCEMKRARLARSNKLQRLKPPEPNDPLDIFYAGLGYLGVLYESQLVYVKHRTEQPVLSERDEQFLENLQAAHELFVDLSSRLFSRHELDVDVLQNFQQTSTLALKQLAEEGKRFVNLIKEERKNR
jgi:hypothetical protein